VHILSNYLLGGRKCFIYLSIFSVLYCTLLNQAQTEAEKQNIIKQMESDGELLKILRKLQETDKEDIVTEERQRRQAARKTRVEADLDTMDVDDAGVCFCSFVLDC
jgi:hypothetical protein